VNEGRTRNTGGGSGLGLAICKKCDNCFINGSIVAKTDPKAVCDF